MLMMCQRIGSPPISTMGLGLVWVSSDRRVPSPPARITVRINGSRRGSPPQAVEGLAGRVLPAERVGALQALRAEAAAQLGVAEHFVDGLGDGLRRRLLHHARVTARDLP